MRIAYLDCFAGISGDMFLGALLDAEVPLKVLEEATSALHLGASLRVETVDRSGISATKVHVLEGEQLAEGTHLQAPDPMQQQPEKIYTQQPRTQHLHKTGHPHTHAPAESDTEVHAHSHGHTHGRSLTVIRQLIESSDLADPVKQTSILAFELLGHAEAKIHNVPVDDIHFHEVGAVDAIVDIVAACAGIHHLQIGQWHASPLNVGGGMVQCAHGNFPVPAPATAELLRGMPTYSAHLQKELVTPTGAALVRMLNPTFGEQPAMRVDRIGYGAGTRNPEGFPNVLRLTVGDSATMPVAIGQESTQMVTVLETALDDLSPQLLAHVAQSALALGALDAMMTPVLMKKGRPGTLLTLLCEPQTASALERLLFRETSTLGVRIRQDRRSCLDRSHVPVATPYGSIRIKVGSRRDEQHNAAPEFEDCRTAAAEHKVPIKQVQQAAIAAWVDRRV